jgi:hypothetical protein
MPEWRSAGSSATRASRLRMPGSRLPNICRKDDLTSGRNDDVTSGRNDDVTSGDEEFSAAANSVRIRAMEAVWKQHEFKFKQITWVAVPVLFYAFKVLIRQQVK